MVELLVIMGVETKDALLHAINAEFVEAVELLLEHEELIFKEGELYVSNTATHFSYHTYILVLHSANLRHTSSGSAFSCCSKLKLTRF